MAADRVSEAWASYRREIDRFYEVAGLALDAGELLRGAAAEQADAALGGAAEASQILREVLLPDGGEHAGDRATVLVLAAAAVDSLVGLDGLRVGPEPLEQDPQFAERAMEEPPERGVLLEEADALFGGPPDSYPVAGAAEDPDNEQLLVECREALDRLVKSANGPALRFSFNAINFGANFTVAFAVGQLEDLVARAGFVKRHAAKLLREAFSKLIGAAGENSVEWAIDRVRQGIETSAARVLGAIAGLTKADMAVTAALASRSLLPPEKAASIRRDLHSSEAAYVDQMKWTGTVARIIGYASPLISALGGGLVVLALDGGGVAFVVYTLAARLGGYSSLPSRVPSVVVIVDRNLP
jgi:hypothetical protein